MRGGKRPGAGRKKGSLGKKTAVRKAVSERALAEGVTPLDILLMAMRDAYAAGGARAAAEYAKDAAPYVHPRLSAIAAKIGASMNPWDEFARFIDELPSQPPGGARPESGGTPA